MFIELTQNEKTTIHNKFKNSGFEITEIDLTTAEFSVSDNNKSTSCIVELPDKTKGYNDYSAIMLWTNDESGYSSFPVPLSYNSVMGEGETAELIDIRITLQDVEPGKIKIIFSVYDDNYDYTFFDDMILSLESLALFSAPYLNVSAENTIIAGNVGNLFDTYSASDKDILSLESILKEKRNILTCDYDEETANDLIKHYTVSWREPTGTSTEPVFDGTNYYAPVSKVNLTYVPFIKIDGLIGYTSDAYDSLDEQTKLNASTINTQKLNEEISKLSVKARYVFLEKDLIYPVGNTVKDNGDNGIANVSKCIELGSNVTLVGNNATLCAVTGNNVVSVIFGSNKIVRNPNMTYGNSHFYNLNVIGRYTDTDKPADQAVHCANVNVNESYTALPKNVTFNNCKFTDFCFGIHINNNAYYDIPLYWTFDNCDFKTGMGFNLTGVKNLKLLNSHIDNCLSSGKGNHCIYISEKCSYITVDHCLLENSTGGAIHQMFGFALYDSTFNEHNTYKNLTISSCFTAIHIGPASRDTVVENVVVFDSMRVIMLESCINTKIKNVKLAGEFYYKRLNSSDNKWYEPTYNPAKPNQIIYPESVWYLISLKGMVDADIEDCNFKFSSPFSSCCAYSNYMIGEEGASKIYEIKCEGISVFENQKAWFKESTSTDGETFYLVTPSVRFRNCQFDSTYNLNDYTNVFGYQNGDVNEGTNTFFIKDKNNKIVANIAYKLKLKFDKCKFNMNYDKKGAPYFRVVGNTKASYNAFSECEFTDCTTACYIEDCFIITTDDEGNTVAQKKKMYRGFFVNVCNGSKMAIRNCDFYTNLDKEDTNLNPDYLWITTGYPNPNENVIDENNICYYEKL